MKLLITDKIDEKGIAPLGKYFEIDKRIGIAPDILASIIADYDCIITRSSTALPRDLIEKANKLKIIARAGIGVDNIDIFAATERKIAVINAPKGNASVTAEHTIGLLFALLRHISQAAADLKLGVWNKKRYIGNQIAGKTLGIVGFGNVGKHVYKIAAGVGLNVLVCEPYVRMPKKVKKVTYEELLKDSDIISFHVPATYLTKRMLNKHTLTLCKDNVYIINCSRGDVVDEKAIKEGLLSGKIAGFAVDVFKSEPEVDPELLSFPNVIATPHIAGSTYESQKQSIQEVVKGIAEYIKGIPPNNLLNPQVFKKRQRRKSIDGFAFDSVIFDCDSTLSSVEGIDELASLVGMGRQVAALTKAAMEGTIPFESVYEKRLELLKPKRELILQLGSIYRENLVEDAKEVIEGLQLLGITIYIVSGGFSAALVELGRMLALPDRQIFGTDLIHDEKGNFQGFVEGPLRRNNGKLQIIRQIPGRKLVVGDSITDLETKEIVDLFVGYGGVVRRKRVEKEAEVYLYHRSLSPILIIASGYEKSLKLLSTKYRRYVGKGLDLLFHPKHVLIDKKINQRFAEFRQLAHY